MAVLSTPPPHTHTHASSHCASGPVDAGVPMEGLFVRIVGVALAELAVGLAMGGEHNFADNGNRSTASAERLRVRRPSTSGSAHTPAKETAPEAICGDIPPSTNNFDHGTGKGTSAREGIRFCTRSHTLAHARSQWERHTKTRQLQPRRLYKRLVPRQPRHICMPKTHPPRVIA